MTTHIMIDLETMDTAPTAAIVSIGAVQFDPVAGTLGPEFYLIVSLETCLAAGLTVSGSTVMWWLGQSDAARAELTQPAWPLHAALDHLDGWYPGGAPVWGHGATFDVSIIENAYRRLGRSPPWDRRAPRDTRTVFEAAAVDMRSWPSAGVAHRAVDDARNQAAAVVEAYRRLGLQRLP